MPFPHEWSEVTLTCQISAGNSLALVFFKLLVSWGVLDEGIGLLKGSGFRVTVLITQVEVLGDEVATRLDLLDVLFDGLLGMLRVFQINLLGCKLFLFLCEIFVQG